MYINNQFVSMNNSHANQSVDIQYINEYKVLSKELKQRHDDFNKEIEQLEQKIQDKRAQFRKSIQELDTDVEIASTNIMKAAAKIIKNITNIILEAKFNNIDREIGINNYIRKFDISIANDIGVEGNNLKIPYRPEDANITFEPIEIITDNYITFYVEQIAYGELYSTGYITIPLRYFQSFYINKEVYVEDENNYIEQICNQIRDEETKQSDEEKRLKIKELYAKINELEASLNTDEKKG